MSKEKRVILIKPRIEKHITYIGFPASLLSVASYTHDFPIRVIDEQIEEIEFDDMEDALVGITSMTCQASRAKLIAKKAHKAGAYGVVFGGIHPTICTEEMLSYGSVVVGEIEGGSWRQVLSDYKNNRELKKIYSTPLVPLKNLPLAPKEVYKYTKQYATHHLSHTRGCPMGCEYCTVHIIAGKKYRQRPVDEIIKEVSFRGLLEGRDDFSLMLCNENLGSLPSEIELLERLKKALDGRYLSIGGQISVSTLNNEEFLTLLNSFKHVLLSVGVESPYRHSLSTIKKGIKNIDVIKAFEKARSYSNLLPIMLLMIGFDFEPRDVFEDVLEFIKQVRPYAVYLSIITPLPGSRIRERLEAEGRIFDRNWAHYDTRHLVFEKRYRKSNAGYGIMTHNEFMEGYNLLKRECLTAMNEGKTSKNYVR